MDQEPWSCDSFQLTHSEDAQDGGISAKVARLDEFESQLLQDGGTMVWNESMLLEGIRFADMQDLTHSSGSSMQT